MYLSVRWHLKKAVLIGVVCIREALLPSFVGSTDLEVESKLALSSLAGESVYVVLFLTICKGLTAVFADR